jgi:hypothetical protein
VAICEAGEVRSAGRIHSDREELELFAQSLGASDEVVMAPGSSSPTNQPQSLRLSSVVTGAAKNCCKGRFESRQGLDFHP